MTIRGVRGAVIAQSNTREAILAATRSLLEETLVANPGLRPEDVASAFFTMTEDLNAIFPAEAARQLGWQRVPLMCAREIAVPGSLGSCIRVLIHWNTEVPQYNIQHVYLGEAVRLRPDLKSIPA